MYNDLVDTIGFVGGYDKEVADAMGLELERQQRNLELIASENIVSPAVMAAMGSVLTNKYADRARQKAFRSKFRERTGTFGRAGEHGGVFRADKPRRYRYGNELGARRTPYSRLSRKYFGKVL